MKQTETTKKFYDKYWPQNLPDQTKTREHVLSLLPAGRRFELALDAGCGTGVCSLALADVSDRVIAVDISPLSLETAKKVVRSKENVDTQVENLLELSFADSRFDLVFSWGVIHHTTNPVQALDELVRVLKPGGTIVLAVYLKTNLTFLQEGIRKTCLRLPTPLRKAFIASLAALLKGTDVVRKPIIQRDDSGLKSLIEDWFFVPEKHFFSISEMKSLFGKRNLSFEVLHERTARFKSSSNFIVRGVKQSAR